MQQHCVSTGWKLHLNSLQSDVHRPFPFCLSPEVRSVIFLPVCPRRRALSSSPVCPGDALCHLLPFAPGDALCHLSPCLPPATRSVIFSRLPLATRELKNGHPTGWPSLIKRGRSSVSRRITKKKKLFVSVSVSEYCVPRPDSIYNKLKM